MHRHPFFLNRRAAGHPAPVPPSPRGTPPVLRSRPAPAVFPLSRRKGADPSCPFCAGGRLCDYCRPHGLEPRHRGAVVARRDKVANTMRLMLFTVGAAGCAAAAAMDVLSVGFVSWTR